MAWWPFSSTGADAKAQSAQSSTEHASAPATPQAQSAPSPDHDFYAAHPHLAPPALRTNAPPTSSTDAPTGAPTDADADDLDPSLPRTMSCRAAFDSAFYCSSLGGHFNDLYRHGQLRSCSDHWNDFWFCMRTKNSYSGPEVKARLIQERYKEKEDALKAKANSEDIWTKRGPGEEVKNPFALAGRQD